VCVCVRVYVCVHTGEIQTHCLAETDSNRKQWSGNRDVQRESICASQAMAGAIGDEVTVMLDAGNW
jgi:hypothetical protein